MIAYGIKHPNGTVFVYHLGSSEPDAWAHFRAMMIDKPESALKADGYRCVPVEVTWQIPPPEACNEGGTADGK